jgi:hypothetical protein
MMMAKNKRLVTHNGPFDDVHRRPWTLAWTVSPDWFVIGDLSRHYVFCQWEECEVDAAAADNIDIGALPCSPTADGKQHLATSQLDHYCRRCRHYRRAAFPTRRAAFSANGSSCWFLGCLLLKHGVLD